MKKFLLAGLFLFLACPFVYSDEITEDYFDIAVNYCINGEYSLATEFLDKILLLEPDNKKIKDLVDSKCKSSVAIDKGTRDEIIQSITVKKEYSEFFGEDLDKALNDYKVKKIIIWADPYARCQKYKNYILQYEKELEEYSVEIATTAEQAINMLSKYEFKLIYIIIYYKYFESFIEEYKKIINKLGIVTANIILCENEEEKRIAEKLEYAGDPFFNPGGIATDFQQIICYIKKIEFPFPFEIPNDIIINEENKKEDETVGDKENKNTEQIIKNKKNRTDYNK